MSTLRKDRPGVGGRATVAAQAAPKVGPIKRSVRRFTGLAFAGEKVVHARGVFTTEFLVASLILVGATIALGARWITAEAWLDTAKWIGAGYGLSRGLAKVGGK